MIHNKNKKKYDCCSYEVLKVITSLSLLFDGLLFVANAAKLLL